MLTEDQIKHMVDRFLGWRLPDNFEPDCGISFRKAFNEPTGTNLFDAMQAAAMVRHMIEGMPDIPSRSQEEGRGELPDQETFWLIERRVSPPQYTTSDTCLPALSNDPWRAVRFKSKGEAFGALLKLQTLRDECCVIEHIFINKRPAMMDSRPASAAPLQGATIAQIASVIEGKMFAAHELPLDPELHERYLDTALAVIEAMRPQDQGETRREVGAADLARHLRAIGLEDEDAATVSYINETQRQVFEAEARALLRSFHITPRS